MHSLMIMAWNWGVRCFGREHMLDRRIRALRLLEEALELAQALDVSKEQAMLAVETVYSRPIGSPLQEMGGVLVTAVVLAHAIRTDLHIEDFLRMELERCLSKPPEHFAKRNDEKKELGLR